MVHYVKVKHKRKILLQSVKYCDTFLSRSKGLMFSKKLKKGEGVLLVVPKESREATSIHMLFVFFSLDILWLDKDKRVVDMKRKIPPFRFLVVPCEKAKYVLEVPVGSLSGSLVGEILDFK